jgi:hypothetical protein
LTKPAGYKAKRKPKQTPGGCPIGEDSLKIAELSHDLVRALRRLRRDLQHCQECARQTSQALGCPLRGEYNALVSQAVEEVWEEWGR